MGGPAKREMLDLMADVAADVCGERSEVFQDLKRAAETNSEVDLLLASASFDALPGSQRQAVADTIVERARAAAKTRRAAAG